MGKLIIDGIEVGGSSSASSVKYDNKNSTLVSTNVQGAITELNESLTKVNVYVGDDEKIHFVDSEGADSVLPFNKGIDTSGATATAATITEGFTAWVNGELITGTRPAPSKMQSGSFGVSSSSYETVTKTVYFSPEFDTKPEVTYTVNAYKFSMQSVEVYTTHAIFKLLHSHGNDHHSGTVTWTATV